MMPPEEQRLKRLTRVANIALSAVGVFCLLLLVYCLYYYGWTGKRYFTSLTGIILYYGMPAVLAAILFASLRLRPFPKISLALVLVSTAVSIFAANLFLTMSDTLFASNVTLWFRPDDMRELVRVAKNYGVEFDTRSKLEFVRDLRSQGIDAVPSIVPLALLRDRPGGTRKSAITIDGAEVLPHGAISNRVTVHCNESGKHEIYQSDEHGFHNPKGIWGLSRLNIIAMGDSFTQGHCVPSDKNFVALIREHYSDTLNLGMAGQGPLITLATLKDYVQILKPKVVLWFFYEGNDIGDLRGEQKSPLLMRYLDGHFNQRLLDRQAAIDQALEALIKAETTSFLLQEKEKTLDEKITDARPLMRGLIKLSHLRQRLGLVYGESAQADPYAEPDGAMKELIDLLDKALREAKASVDSWGGKLYFVYLPDRDRYADDAVYQRDQVLLTVRHVGIPLIDIHPAFRSQSDPLALFPFRRLGHYNEEGHRIVAQEVLRSISHD